MPRLYTSANNPLDFCAMCFPTEIEALEQYNNVGEGPDNRGNCFDYNSDHPPYEETDYVCWRCQRPLREIDND